jgi:hypothetical protein
MVAVTVPADLPDVMDDEPTVEEIAAAAADEARAAEDAARALASVPDVPTTTQPARRGPGRPPGARNRPKGEAAARRRGNKSSTETRKPDVPGTPPNPEAEREAAKLKREIHKATVNTYVELAMVHRPKLVKGIGLATGLPEQFLVGPKIDDAGTPILVEGAPVFDLTPYGEMLAPQQWQVYCAVEAGVRVMESEQGEKLLELWEKVAPYIFGIGALGALGLYTVTVLKTVEAIKPMIEQQLAEMQQAAQQQQQKPPGGSSAG